MSSNPSYIVAIDTTALSDLYLVQTLSNEQIGAAVLIFAWRARGHDGEAETLRRVANYPKRRWSRDADGILAGVDFLISKSEMRVRMGRPTVSAKRRAAIIERDGAVCRYCGTTEGPFHIDRVEPLSRGGSNRDENLCIACAPCNLRKSAKLGREWLK